MCFLFCNAYLLSACCYGLLFNIVAIRFYSLYFPALTLMWLILVFELIVSGYGTTISGTSIIMPLWSSGMLALAS